MGVVLFHRSPEGLVTTHSALEMVSAAERMEREAQIIAHALSGRSEALEGSVRVALTGDFAAHFLTHRMRIFRRRFPAIELDLVTSDSRVDLPAGEADLAIRFGRIGGGAPVSNREADLLIARPMSEMGFALYAARAYLKRHGTPDSIEALADHHCILPSRGANWMPGYDWITAHVAQAMVALRTDSLSSMALATSLGIGIALLPGFMAIQNKQLVRIALGGVLGVRQAWILIPKSLRHVARIRVVADFIEEVMRDFEDQLSARE
jgi:DNA-binding transcriptional LysR family regulator